MQPSSFVFVMLICSLAVFTHSLSRPGLIVIEKRTVIIVVSVLGERLLRLRLDAGEGEYGIEEAGARKYHSIT